MDEARVGLILSYRALWARIGQRPIASSARRYQWVYTYSFVHPASGELLDVVGQTVSAPIMSAVLAHFAEQVSSGPNRQIGLVLDRAGWHTAKSLVIPEGNHLVFLPPYSPELQPAERLFPLLEEFDAPDFGITVLGSADGFSSDGTRPAPSSASRCPSLSLSL